MVVSPTVRIQTSAKCDLIISGEGSITRRVYFNKMILH